MASHTSSPEARSRAIAKYIKKTYDTIAIQYTKESKMKEIVSKHAAARGESVSAFIKRAIDETIERDLNKDKENN